MILLCREVDRSSGKVIVYPLDTEVTDRVLTRLWLRSRYNPELTYYVTLRTNYESNKDLILKTIKKVNLSEKVLQVCAAKIDCGIKRV